MENKTYIREKEYAELHNKLVQTVIDFFKEKGLPENSDRLTLSIDGLKESVDIGQWHPGTDSAMELWDYENNCLFWEV